jgi:hypothetical protein
MELVQNWVQWWVLILVVLNLHFLLQEFISSLERQESNSYNLLQVNKIHKMIMDPYNVHNLRMKLILELDYSVYMWNNKHNAGKHLKT